VLLLVYAYGISTGYSDLKKSTDVYAIVQKEKPENVRQLVLLRAFDKGILVRDFAAQRIEFIKWDDINSISRLLTTEKTVGYLCLWFGIVCRGTDPNPIIP
jgi:hypothetical protein